ncbi:MAG TPA: alkaline phosphatase family protein [Candidatus Baltobacteraceae bacterium]|nr:alkaline phosphatase family protein [Candidatus Baltobacteraceae bacterium]
MMRVLHYGSLLALFTCITIIGCSGTSSTVPPSRPTATPNAQPTRCPAANYTCIQHVVIIIQENRTFNNLFMGFPGAETRSTGKAGSHIVPLRQRGLEQSVADISHCWDSAMTAWDNGKMDGFYQVYPEKWPLTNCPSLARPAVGTSGVHSPYVYVPNGAPNYVDEAGPYWKMAMQYVLADHYFPTDFGPSFTAHQYLVAGTTDVARNLAIVNYPGVLNKYGGVDVTSASSWSCDSPSFSRTSLLDAHRMVASAAGPFPCFTQYRTIADSLDARGISWQFYTPKTKNFGKGDYIWSPFSAIDAVRHGPDWSNVITPNTDVLAAAQNGKLKAVTWVVPDGTYSDHAGPYVTDEGPSWVSAVVNAVGKGPQWNSTAIIVLWDDWGGLYDPIPPPQMDFRGLGIRTPLMVISPYAQRSKVDKTLYEPGSILKFIETVFKLPPIAGSCPAMPANGFGYTDCRANVLGGFDFRQTPRAFTPIKAKYPPSKFTSSNADAVPPDTE